MPEKVVIHNPQIPTVSAVEQDVLNAIRELAQPLGLPPSLAELADRLGCSAYTARDRVQHLEQRGLVIRTPGKNRSLRLTLGGSMVANAATAAV